MPKAYPPQAYHGDVEYLTSWPPQSAFNQGGGAPPVETFNELIEEVALTFDTCLHEEVLTVFGDMVIDETGRLLTFDNEVIEEVLTTFDNLVSEETLTIFNNMVILETAP